MTYSVVSCSCMSWGLFADVNADISAIFENINDTFAREMTEKQTKLNATEASVRHATRALADKRQQVQRSQSALGELEHLQQKADNVRRALASVGSQDWTGRPQNASPAFRPLPGHVPAPIILEGLGEEVPAPVHGETDELIKLSRLAMWEDRMAAVLEERLRALEGESADKAVKYRRLVSLCTRVPVEKVDSVSGAKYRWVV